MEEVRECWNLGEEVKEPKKLRENANQTTKDKHEAAMAKYEAYKRKKQILLWWVDCYLAMIVGVDSWGPTIRPYFLPTDKRKGADGKDKMCVPRAGEAFALVQFENSRERWLQVFKWKKANPGKKNPPQYSANKPETHDFKAKWSDYSHGQGSGWDPEAYSVFNRRMEAIKAFREEEAANGFPRMKEAKKLIRAYNEIPANQNSHPTSRAARRQQVEVDDDGDETEGEEVYVDNDE